MTQTQKERNEVSALFDKAESLRDYPGSYFPARAKARAAKAAWEAKYPAEVEAEKKEAAEFKAKEEARRAEDFKNSFIGRGLD